MKRRSQHEYVSRMAAQRQALNLVNKFDGTGEQLNGLSTFAIQRWFDQSDYPEKSIVKDFLINLSAKLSFLANESQQQITSKYQTISKEFFEVLSELERKLKSS